MRVRRNEPVTPPLPDKYYVHVLAERWWEWLSRASHALPTSLCHQYNELGGSSHVTRWAGEAAVGLDAGTVARTSGRSQVW